MKNSLTALLPAMALLALGGCASTAGLATSEDDGVYYSSKDRTTAVVAAAPAPAATDEAANPDYHGGSAKSSASQGTGSDQYYDNTYTYMKGVPTSPGLAYYTPYSPYTTLSYAGAYGYGWGGGACGFSPYPCVGVYDPFYSSFYSPFYSPFGYGYRSGISVSFGFGYGRSYGYYGYSPFGYGYSPYGYGYGGFYDPFYSPYYYGGAFYGGYYGRGGYYGNSYNGGYYGNSGSYDNRGNGRTYGHRTDRASEGRASTAGVNSGSTPAPVPAGGGRMRSEMVVQPGTTPTSTPDGVSIERSRGRSDAGSLTSTPGQEQSTGGFNRPQRMDRTGQPQYRDMSQPTTISAQPDAAPAQGQDIRDNGRGRWRNADANPQGGQMQPTAAPQPVENERRRGGFFRNLAGDQPANNGGQTAEQPQRRSYEQPRPQRTFEQPQRTFEQPQQRSYEQPQQRSYEQPRQERTFSQPSYSAPSYGGGGGGGNSGGGGGGGRRGRD
ncbi:hypothetical protein [Hymenobacter properus]|uniref:Prolyl-tRNA synthetase n=1 Tax=Hymenobacter properus TaxID=2791026 RepID=A0A931FKB0_9BACT|nr:hypothetical protein [Hymenobacter properus]MBF9141510.1 hypothetical protein [Hymenobacter properus]MBR7720319.1 hypothetical protein [Microvirga sp. SRT04]